LRFPGGQGKWEEYKISDILEIFSTNSLSWEQLEYGINNNIYNLHYGLIHKGFPTQIDLEKCTLPSIKDEFIPNNYTICKEGDVAFADASEDTNDVAKVVEFYNCNNKKIVCGLHTIHGRDKLGLTITGYKGYAFSANAFRQQIRKLAQGTKIYSISTKNFNESYICIPSKKEQKKIAGLMYLIDQRIEAQNKIIEKYESLIKGITHLLFDAPKPNVRLNDIVDCHSSTLRNCK
jgi:type I restriction enzyme S subunit